MRANIILFRLLSGFFLLAAIVYVVWSALDHNWDWARIEWVGAVGITLAAALAFLIQFYLTLTNRTLGGTLPEDREDADIDDGEAEQGHFSPWSWWPFMLGLALALMFLGLAVGTWIAIIGAPLVLISVIGWHYEYYRGYFGR